MHTNTNATGTTVAEHVEDVLERSQRIKETSDPLIAGREPFWIDSVGQYLCKEVRLQVGSQVLDTVYSHYLKMWSELSDKPGRKISKGYGQMVMKGTRQERRTWSRTARSVYVPLQMFFMRTSGNTLPLIALSFHGVKILLKTADTSKAINNFNPGSKSTTMIRAGHESSNSGKPRKLERTTAETLAATVPFTSGSIRVELSLGYVYLGVAERNKFAEASFEILIDQVQQASDQVVRGTETLTVDKLGFNHCVQELLWAVTLNDRTDDLKDEPMEYRGPLDGDAASYRDTLHTVMLKLNNSKRFNHTDADMVPAAYFRQVEPYLRHTCVPDAGVYCYSFALNPESSQPSGSCNFSRIDHASFKAVANLETGTTGTLHMFARNWNVFRISLGLGGLVWAS